MATEITIPRLGWNMDEGIFVGWLKNDGQHVSAGEPLFSLEGERRPRMSKVWKRESYAFRPNGPNRRRKGRGRRVGSATWLRPASRHL